MGVLGRESLILGNFAPQKPKICQSASASGDTSVPFTCAVREIARRVDVGSACVDIRLSPKTDVLVLLYIALVFLFVASSLLTVNKC